MLVEVVAVFSETLSAYSLLEWALASLAILASTTLQYGMGIGFGVIAGPLLALISIDLVPVPVLFCTCVTAGLAAIGERGNIRWRETLSGVAGRGVGSVIAIMILFMLPGEKAFMLLFGLVVAFAVLVSVAGLRLPFSLPAVGGAGIISGFTAAITGVGGPPMALVYQNQSAIDARPTLQSYFAVGSFLTLTLLAVSGNIDGGDIAAAVLLLPALVAGFLLGPFMRPFFNRNFKPFLLGIAGVAAAILIVRSLT